MKKSVSPLATLAVALGLALAFGSALDAAAQELSQIYRDWRSGPVQLLLLPDEETAWEELSNDAGAEAFIRLFWARRDPTPGTALNEFQRDFEQRAAYADEEFEEEETRGSLTDRGRVFLLLGPPRRVQNPGARGSTTGGSMGEEGTFSTSGSIPSGGGPGRYGRGGNADRLGVASEERWIYEDENKPEFVDLQRFAVRFLSKPGSDVVELRDGQQALSYMARARERVVLRPDLTAADLPSTGGSPSAGGAAPGEVRAWMGEQLSGADAVEALRAALGGTNGGLNAHLDAGAFEASDGRWIVPYQVSTTSDPGSEPARVVGELVASREPGAEPLVAFRLEQAWSEQRGQRYVKDTLVVPPGDYELRVGVEDDAGAIRWAGRAPVEVPAPGDEFWVSELIFSDSVYPMDEPQQMLEPYAWQGIVVVPRGDRTFRQGELLWFYLHACQPALDSDGKPDLKVTVKVEGPSRSRDSMPVQPVRAGDDCWVIASGVNLSPAQFPAGDYEMTVLVRDTEAATTLSSGGRFTVAAP